MGPYGIMRRIRQTFSSLVILSQFVMLTVSLISYHLSYLSALICLVCPFLLSHVVQ